MDRKNSKMLTLLASLSSIGMCCAAVATLLSCCCRKRPKTQNRGDEQAQPVYTTGKAERKRRQASEPAQVGYETLMQGLLGARLKYELTAVRDSGNLDLHTGKARRRIGGSRRTLGGEKLSAQGKWESKERA